MNTQELLAMLPAGQPALTADDGSQPRDLVFDDEPVESVLYGSPSHPPTPASIFQPARDLLQRLSSDAAEATSEQALQRYLRFIDDRNPVSGALCLSLLEMAFSLLPVWPKPLSPDTPPSLGPLLDRLWQHARTCDNEDLKRKAASRLWEWYEYVGRHADAREVLAALETLLRRHNEDGELPGVINNYAFQFQKERLWKEAADAFDHAARMADSLRQTLNYANSRANYWGCRYELEGLAIAPLSVPEMKRLAAILHDGRWAMSERKVLVLLARVETASGNPAAAIPLLEQAIAIDESQGSMYTEPDRAMLREVQAKEGV